MTAERRFPAPWTVEESSRSSWSARAEWEIGQPPQPSSKFLFRCRDGVWWISTCAIFQRSLAKWTEEGKTTAHWSAPRSLVLRARICSPPFGTSAYFMEQSTRRSRPPTLPIESFAYLVFYLKQHQPSGAKLIELIARCSEGATACRAARALWIF
jgi:hypothetical protein